MVTLLGLAWPSTTGCCWSPATARSCAPGTTAGDAVARAWATAGRTMLFSALTVAAALSGLLMFDVPTLTALGAAGVSIALVCMLASLTFTAALIGLLRRWIRPSRRPPSAPPRPRRRGRARHVRPASRGRCSAGRSGRAGHDGAAAARRRTAARHRAPPARSRGHPAQHRGGPGRRHADRPVRASPAAPAITVVARTDAAALDAWAARWADDPAVSRVRPAGSWRRRSGPLATVAFDVDRRPAGRRPPGTWSTGCGPTGPPAGSPGSPATPRCSPTCWA